MYKHFQLGNTVAARKQHPLTVQVKGFSFKDRIGVDFKGLETKNTELYTEI